jgi:nucleotide-binding universal stress UspA family protein
MILMKHILVATDFSEPSEAALAHGRALATTFGARLHLLHVMQNLFLRPVPGDPHALKAATIRNLELLLTDDDRKAQAVAALETSDAPAEAIVEYARAHAIDLIVLGTHGRSGMARVLIGSVAENVVRTAPCPVLTMRHPAHDFVVPDAEPSGEQSTDEQRTPSN